MSDRTSPDSTKLGEWLFQRRTLLPLPIAAAILLIPSGETSRNVAAILGGVLWPAVASAQMPPPLIRIVHRNVEAETSEAKLIVRNGYFSGCSQSSLVYFFGFLECFL